LFDDESSTYNLQRLMLKRLVSWWDGHPARHSRDLLAYCNDGQDARPTEEGVASLLSNDTANQIGQKFWHLL
jgi:hypothetical protein